MLRDALDRGYIPVIATLGCGEDGTVYNINAEMCIRDRVYSTPPAAAPRAQCLCPRVSGTVPGVLPGRHGRLCVARSAHGEAEMCIRDRRTADVQH